MQKIFFTVLLVVTVLVTVRLHNYKQETTGLFANTAADETLIPGAVPPPAEEKRIMPKTRTTANSKKSTRKLPPATKKR